MKNVVYKNFKIDAKYIDENMVWDIIYPIIDGISVNSTEKQYLIDLQRFSIPQINAFVIYSYMSEINNGGHSQFYYNPVGQIYPELIEALKDLNLQKLLEIFIESTKRMGPALSRNRETRMKYLNEVNPDFDDLDGKFFDLCENDYIEKILKKYILQNKGNFYFEGKLKIIELPDVSDRI